MTGIAAIALVAIAALVSATSARAASMRVEGWHAAGLTEHFHLTFPLSRSWDQATEGEEGGSGGEDGPPAANVGAYVTAVGLRAGGRCELRLESNAKLTTDPPVLREGLLEGPGVDQLALDGKGGRPLVVERSGAGAARRWYLGRPQGRRAAAVLVEQAPPGQTPTGHRFVVAEYAIAWKAYREPRPVWHARPVSVAQQAGCRRIALARYRTSVLRAVEQARPAKGHVQPQRPLGRYREPECVLHSCTVLAKDQDLVVYRAENQSEFEPAYERTLVVSPTRGSTTSLASVGIEGPRLGRFVLAGAQLAFTEQVTGRYNGEPTVWSIGRFDAGSGRVELVGAALGGENALRYPSGVTGLVLDPAGAVAWIIGGPPATPKLRSVYYLAPGSATPVRLANGEAIDPASLAIASGRLRWSERGAAREASID